METDLFKLDPQRLVSDLTYINYAYNRRRSPDVSPERWEKVYGPQTWVMEERFQREQGRE